MMEADQDRATGRKRPNMEEAIKGVKQAKRRCEGPEWVDWGPEWVNIIHHIKKPEIKVTHDHEWEEDISEAMESVELKEETSPTSVSELEEETLTVSYRGIIEREFQHFRVEYKQYKSLKELKDRDEERALREQEADFNPFWWPKASPEALNKKFNPISLLGMAAQAYKASSDWKNDLDQL